MSGQMERHPSRRRWRAKGGPQVPRFRRARARRSPYRRALDYLFIPALLTLLLLVAGRLDQVGMRELNGRIVVNDGDTVTLAGERMRLRGIDAPELSQTCSRDGSRYACGRQAREALAALTGGRTVNCSGWKRDRYGRLLVTCRTDQGTELNRRMVEQGWAIAYGGYDDAERLARDGKQGLWAGSFDRPADWRVVHGELAEFEPAWTIGIWNWLLEAVGLAPTSTYKQADDRPEGS
jgi:endonuclease YncB( thermonuclease family)